MRQLLEQFLQAVGKSLDEDVYIRCLVHSSLTSETAGYDQLTYVDKSGKRRGKNVSGFLRLEKEGWTFYKKHWSGQKYESGIKGQGLVELAAINSRKFGIFFVVNSGGQTKNQITHATSYFYEHDEVSLERQQELIDNLPIRPSVVVKSSKSLHVYYRCPKDISLDHWQRVQHALVAKQGADKSIQDYSRLLRLPGFTHWKVKNDRFVSTPVTVQQINEDTPFYTYNEIYNLFGFEQLNETQHKLRWRAYIKSRNNQESDLYEIFNSKWKQVCETSTVAKRVVRSYQSNLKRSDNSYILNNAEYLPDTYNFNYHTREEYATFRCPVHTTSGVSPLSLANKSLLDSPVKLLGNGSTDHIHVHKQSGAIVAHCGCDVADVVKATRSSILLEKRKKYATPTLSRNDVVTVDKRYCPEQSYKGIEIGGKQIGGCNGIHAIRADWGTGKTYSLSGVAKGALEDGKRILVVTHRNSLAEDMGKKFQAISHRDIKRQVKRKLIEDNLTVALSTQPGLAITVDSLARQIDMSHYPKDSYILVIDEISQVLNYLANSSTLRDCRVDARSKLEQVIREASRVLVMDADLSDLELDYLEKIRGEKCASILVNQYASGQNSLPFNVNLSSHPAQDVNNLMQMIANGEKVIVSTTSKKLAETIEQQIQENFNEIKVLSVNSSNSELIKTQMIIKNINEEIINYDVLIHTPSIGTGVSIDVDHFTARYVFAGDNLSSGDIVQGVFRYRKSVPTYIWLSNKINYYFFEHEDILKQLRAKTNIANRVASEISSRGLHYDYRDFEIVEDDYLDLWVGMRSRELASRCFTAESVILRLRQAGFTLNIVSDEASPSQKTEMKEVYERLLENKIIEFDETDELDYGEQILMDEKASQEEKREAEKRLKKTEFVRTVGEEWSDHPYLKRLLIEDKFYDPFYWLVSVMVGNKIFRDKDAEEMEKGVRGNEIDFKSVNYEATPVNEIVAVLKKKEWTNKDLQQFSDKIKTYPDLFTAVFGVDPNTAYSSRTFNHVLSFLGLKTKRCKIKTESGRVNGYRLDDECLPLLLCAQSYAQEYAQEVIEKTRKRLKEQTRALGIKHQTK